NYGLDSPPARNNFSGFVGMKFTVGSMSMSISSLGRVCLGGNSASHTVEIVSAATGAVLPGASAVVNMAGCISGQFVYGAVSGVTLSAGATYYVASQETSGGDQWYDHGSIATTADAVVGSSIYSLDGSAWTASSGPNTSYVPPNFLYTLVAPG